MTTDKISSSTLLTLKWVLLFLVGLAGMIVALAQGVFGVGGPYRRWGLVVLILQNNPIWGFVGLVSVAILSYAILKLVRLIRNSLSYNWKLGLVIVWIVLMMIGLVSLITSA